MKQPRKIGRDIGDLRNDTTMKQPRKIRRDINDCSTKRRTLEKKTSTHAFVDDGIEAWTRMLIKKSLWRFRGQYDADDLLSEAWIVLDGLTKYYGDSTIKRLMALYKTSLIRRFRRLAEQNQYRTDNLCDIDDAFDIEMPSRPIVACLVDAPIDVRDAIIALFEADFDTLTKQPYKNHHETYDERFYRIIDNAPKDIAKRIRDFLRDDVSVR